MQRHRTRARLDVRLRRRRRGIRSFMADMSYGLATLVVNVICECVRNSAHCLLQPLQRGLLPRFKVGS